MKNFGFSISVAVFLFLFVGCNGSSEAIEQEDALKDEVFAIHDEVMPRMSDIVRLKGSLKEMPTDSINEMEAKTAHTQLEKAEDAMMDWMNKFTPPGKLRETKSHEEIMDYLQNEKLEITKVRDAMNSSIEAAEQFLKTSVQ